MSEFKKELSTLINKYSIENTCNTPDFILAEYLNGCLSTFSLALKARDSWYCDTADKIRKKESEDANA